MLILDPDIFLQQAGVGAQKCRFDHLATAPIFDKGHTICERKHGFNPLLNQNNGLAFIPHCPDGVADQGNHGRLQPLCRFIQQQDRRFQTQRAGGGQHLLFAA